jgi:hypothetical protein
VAHLTGKRRKSVGEGHRGPTQPMQALDPADQHRRSLRPAARQMQARNVG